MHTSHASRDSRIRRLRLIVALVLACILAVMAVAISVQLGWLGTSRQAVASGPAPSLSGQPPQSSASPSPSKSSRPKQHRKRSQHAPVNCTPDAILVNPCRPWFGGTAFGNPGTPGEHLSQNSTVQFDHLESLIGHPLDIYRSYHSPLSWNNGTSTLPFTPDELHFAERPGTYLDVNWKPASTWKQAMAVSQGGSAAINAQIRQAADNIKAIAPHKIFLTLWWEPQGSVSNGTSNCCRLEGGCPGDMGGTSAAGAGSPAQYVAMWQNVENIFAQQGVTNVIWTMDYMSNPASSLYCLVPQLWPGNSLIDWVVYDTYDHDNASGTTWANTVGRFYQLLGQESSASADFLSKPWGLGEFGTCRNPSPANERQYFEDGAAAVRANDYPRLKMYIIFANTGNASGGSCLTDYDEGSSGQLVYDPQKQQAFNQLAQAVLSR